MEENKKETVTKKATPKKKTTETKKSESKNTTAKKKTEKKAASKKETVKSKPQSTKKVSGPKKAEKDVGLKENKTEKVEKIEKVEKEEKVASKNKDLEKTIIFDGRQSKNIADVVNRLEEDNIVLDDKIIKRSKAKKNAIIILIILIVAVICATTYYVVDAQHQKNEMSKTLDSNIFKKVSDKYNSADEIDNTNVGIKDESKYSNINSITLAQFEERSLSKEDMVVLVASETCYASMSFEPLLNEVFSEYDMTLYKVNISKYTKEQEQTFRTYFAYTSTPTLFTIKAGIVTSVNVGTLSEENLRAWIEENVK